MDLPKTSNMAMQAHCLSRSTAERLDKLCRFLGLENNRLPYDEDSVVALHCKALDLLDEKDITLETEAILEWATALNAFDESYLRVVVQHTFSKEPWAPYLQLANVLMARQPASSENNVRFAYACLDSARKHLRYVAYFYARAAQGVRAADEAFADTVDDEIVAQLYPDLIPGT